MKLYDSPELAKKIYTMWKDAGARQKEWREDAQEDFNFVAGKQWSEADSAKLNEENRPIITFNRCNAVISAVLGLEANQRQEVSYKPREFSDTKLAEAVDQIGDWVRDYASIEVEEAQLFEHMLTCGMGWMDTYMDYETDLDGKIVQEVLSPFEVRWDFNSRKRNLSDAEWVIRGKSMTVDQIKENWPDAEITITDDFLSDNPLDEPTMGYTPPGEAYSEASKSPGPAKKMPMVLQCQWYETEPVYRVADPSTGNIAEVAAADFKKYKDVIESGIPVVKQKKRVYYQAFVLGGEVLEKSKLSCQTGFTLKCVTGKRDEIGNSWYGIVRMMKDPQRWANKFFSTFIDIIDSNAKGGLLVEEGAVSDIRKFEEDWAKSDSIVWARQGAISQNRIIPKPSPQYPQATDRLLQFSIQSIYDVTGVNVEMLGMADRAQPGIVEESRKRSAYTILASFFDNMRMYRKASGLTLLEYVKNYIPSQRIVEVLEPELRDMAPMVKSIDLRQVNVIVSESPTSDNHKMIVWNFIAQVAPALAKAGIPIPPEIIQYSPLPSTLATKWMAMLKPEGGGSPEQQLAMMGQQMQQMQQALQQFAEENQKLKNQEAVKMAELAQKKELSTAGLIMEKEKMQAEFAMRQAEMQKEFEAEIIKIRTESELKMEQFNQELAAKREMHMIDANKDILIEAHKAQNESKEDEGEDSREEVKPMNDMMKMMGDVMMKMAETIGAPKKVVRDNTGRISGVVTESN